MVKGWVFHHFLTCFELVYRMEKKCILGMNSSRIWLWYCFNHNKGPKVDLSMRAYSVGPDKGGQ